MRMKQFAARLAISAFVAPGRRSIALSALPLTVAYGREFSSATAAAFDPPDRAKDGFRTADLDRGAIPRTRRGWSLAAASVEVLTCSGRSSGTRRVRAIHENGRLA